MTIIRVAALSQCHQHQSVFRGVMFHWGPPLAQQPSSGASKRQTDASWLLLSMAGGSWDHNIRKSSLVLLRGMLSRSWGDGGAPVKSSPVTRAVPGLQPLISHVLPEVACAGVSRTHMGSWLPQEPQRYLAQS